MIKSRLSSPATGVRGTSIGLPTLAMLAAITFLHSPTSAQNLFVDFNSNQQGDAFENQAGYQPYDANHEDPATFGPRDYAAFGTTVTITPAWPNTTDARVQQSIDRGAGNDANWLGDKLSLLTDWIGSDSRTNNGGNGDWDRDTSQAPTYMTLTLSGLPGSIYSWLSYHHDTEHMWSDFQAEVSTDGGATYSTPIALEMTDSTPGGSPDSATTGLGPFDGLADPDPANLPSTYRTAFVADGNNNVVLRFAPFVDGVDAVAVHKQFFGMNGFELTIIPEPTAIQLALVVLLSLAANRRRQR